MIDTAPGFISPWFRPDWVPPLYLSDSVGWGYNMSSISCARTSCIDLKADRIHLDAPLVSAVGVRNIIQLLAVVLGAASLAACAQGHAPRLRKSGRNA